MQETSKRSGVNEPGIYAGSRAVLEKSGIDIKRVDDIISEDIPIGNEYQYAITDIMNHYAQMAVNIKSDKSALEICTRGLLADLSLFFSPEKHARLYAEAYDVIREVR